MTEPVISIDRLVKRFGKQDALRGLSLDVSPGQTFAFLGPNGAGKTTTIRTLVGLLRPDAGTLQVLGLDPLQEPLEVRRRVGYLAEDQTMYGWMRVEEPIGFVAPFYPTWDHELARRYVREFELPTKTKVKHLSKGQNVRLALLLALAHRPELVILDDPTLGLDPIMRRQFSRDLITHLQGEGRTVFYSSHLLYEVEPVADTVAILDRGVLVRQESTEKLRQHVKRIILPGSIYDSLDIPLRVLDIERSREEIAVTVDDAPGALAMLRQAGHAPRVVELNLDEIFEAFAAGRQDTEDASTPPEVATPSVW
jgi:ABC-2 type transport system ATP-binding protein